MSSSKEFPFNTCLSLYKEDVISLYDFSLCAINQDLKLIPIAMTALVAIFSAVFAFIAISNTRRISQNKNSVDFETELESNSAYTKSYNEYLDVLAEYPSGFGVTTWFLIAMDNKSSYYKLAQKLLNPWEKAANGIKSGVYNNDVIYGVYGSELIDIMDFCMPFIKERRKVKKNARLFEHAEWLYRKWKIRHFYAGMINSNKRLKLPPSNIQKVIGLTYVSEVILDWVYKKLFIPMIKFLPIVLIIFYIFV